MNELLREEVITNLGRERLLAVARPADIFQL